MHCLDVGGKKKDGCGRVVTRDKYLDHGNEPYCSGCYSKLFRPKGFGYGNTLRTDYGPEVTTPATSEKTSEAANSSPALSITTSNVPENNSSSGSVSEKIRQLNSPPRSPLVPPSAGHSRNSSFTLPEGVANRFESGNYSLEIPPLFMLIRIVSLITFTSG